MGGGLGDVIVSCVGRDIAPSLLPIMKRYGQ